MFCLHEGKNKYFKNHRDTLGVQIAMTAARMHHSSKSFFLYPSREIVHLKGLRLFSVDFVPSRRSGENIAIKRFTSFLSQANSFALTHSYAARMTLGCAMTFGRIVFDVLGTFKTFASENNVSVFTNSTQKGSFTKNTFQMETIINL